MLGFFFFSTYVMECRFNIFTSSPHQDKQITKKKARSATHESKVRWLTFVREGNNLLIIVTQKVQTENKLFVSVRDITMKFFFFFEK